MDPWATWFSDLVSGGLELGNLWGPFKHKPFYEFMIYPSNLFLSFFRELYHKWYCFGIVSYVQKAFQAKVEITVCEDQKKIKKQSWLVLFADLSFCVQFIHYWEWK